MDTGRERRREGSTGVQQREDTAGKGTGWKVVLGGAVGGECSMEVGEGWGSREGQREMVVYCQKTPTRKLPFLLNRKISVALVTRVAHGPLVLINSFLMAFIPPL